MDPLVVIELKSGTLQELEAEIRAQGGQPLQAFVPSHVIARLPSGVKLTRGVVSEKAGTALASTSAHSTLEAMRRRERKAGEPALPWDAPGKKPPKHFSGLSSHERAFDGPGDCPRRRHLVGRVAVAVVVVSRPRGPASQDPPAEYLNPNERNKAVEEIAGGMGWLAQQEPRARVFVVVERKEVEVELLPTTEPPTGFEAHEKRWRDPALTSLGFPTGASGSTELARDVRDRWGAQWGFVIFVTRFPVEHFAYAVGDRVILHYENDGWGVDNLDLVAAHEAYHVFGALDEYASSMCTCDERSGELQVENGNCRSCTTAFVDCLMASSGFSMCDFTRGQIGWRTPLIGVEGRIPASARNADGRLEVFYVGMDGVLYHAWQLTPGGAWSGENSL